ncbi:MAG TPA: three-Cys-motif partner protein TcmP [Puia sp.]|nr:three-Cys-motif partner protein TcmP [Puia sp.]
MKKIRKSQVVMLDHSRAKVELLRKYLEKYLNIIANDGFTQRINVFDLFCGEGIYENGGNGSPIEILKVLKDLHTHNKAKLEKIPKVDIYFNDKNAEKIEKLKKAISELDLHSIDYGNLHFSNKDYKDIIDSLAKYTQNLRNEKAFIFIDPYGYKEIRASEIKKLLISKKAEVLLFLPTQFMYRFDEKGTPQSLIEILEELVDLKKWKSNNVYDYIDQFKEALRIHLGSGFFVDTFTIEKDPATVFCLFFFSSHIRGFEKMLETKWQIDEDEGKGWSYEKTGNLFSVHKTNPLEQKLLDLVKKHPKCFNGEVYEYCLRLGFLPVHCNEVFASLQNGGRLDVLSENVKTVRKGAFYISYENYKNEPQKVYFKVK